MTRGQPFVRSALRHALAIKAIDTAEAAEALIQRLHELPSPMRLYRNLERVREPLLAFLERRRRTML